jgi:hypothetical protein
MGPERRDRGVHPLVERKRPEQLVEPLFAVRTIQADGSGLAKYSMTCAPLPLLYVAATGQLALRAALP